MATESIRVLASGLFEYLRELEILRAKPTVDCENYEAVFWFGDLPDNPSWANVARGQCRASNPELWLEVTRPREPVCPPIPTGCEEWVDLSTLNQTAVVPALRIQILSQENSDDGEGLRLLINNPEIQSKWATFMATRWKPWAEDHRKWQVLNEPYSRLYAIYKLLSKLPEEYELVLGLGLVRGTLDSGKIVRRHVLVGQAEISLDLGSGTIRVGAKTGGVKLSLETDMLDASQQPRHDEEQQLRQLVEDVSEDPWDNSGVEAAIRALSNAVDPPLSYHAAAGRPTDVSGPLRISWSPGLVLRKRSRRGLVRCFDAVIQDLKRPDSEVPICIERVCSVVDDNERNCDSIRERDLTDCRGPVVPLFPLPANEEQRAIVDRLESKDAVIVQGPPGTGKSHTIANLICHLLATGRKALVTSQTPRALKVLMEKIPAELRYLCVTVLGNDREALDNLRNSIEKIENE